MNSLRFAMLMLAAVILFGCAGATDDDTPGSSQNPNPPTISASYLKASNTDANDQFGFATAVSADGNTLAIAALGDDSGATGINGNQGDNGTANAGAVYIFAQSGGSWSQQAYIKASNTTGGDQFGLSVSLSADGNTLAVGTSLEDSSATGINGNQTNDSASQSGAVYIFVRTGVTWSQQAYIKASNTAVGDEFGLSVSLSSDGNTLAVGARLEDSNATGVNGNQADNSATQSGAVYVFTRGGTVWTQQAYIKASNTAANDWFGSAVSLSGDGNTLAVGARQEDSNATGVNGNQSDDSASDSGAVYVFTRNVATWTQQAYLKASNTQADDSFGIALSLAGDGNTLAVGACCEDSNATGNNGDQSNNDASASGAVYVFTRTASVWSQQAYVKSSNSGSGDQFGLPVLLSNDGNTMIVAAALEDSAVDRTPGDNSVGESGAVYVLTRSGSTWTSQRFLKAPNADAGDHFGRAIAVSSNGGLVAVGANFEDSNAIGTSGNRDDNSAVDAGAVYLY